MLATADKHLCLEDELTEGGLPCENTAAWILDDVRPPGQPLPYKQPKGAVTWGKLPDVDPPLVDRDDLAAHLGAKREGLQSQFCD